MKRLALFICAFGLLVGCNGEDGTGPGNGNGDTVSADLDLATIDGASIPFVVDQTGDFLTLIVEGSLTLNSDGTWERSTETQITNTSTGSTNNSTSSDGGSYTLDGEMLTLTSDDPNNPAISGTFSNNEATLQIGGRPWLYR